MSRFRASAVAAAALAASLFFVAPAGASGDYGFDPSWRLAHSDLSGVDNMMMLSPGNDTRVNLTLLLADRRGVALTRGKGAPAEPLGVLFDWRTLSGWMASTAADPDSSYASGEGSRCRSNDSGAAAFVAAVNAAKLPGGESATLIAARQGLKPDCAKPGGALTLDAVKSPSGKAFADYLAGAQAFYDGSFDAASAAFTGLRDARNPWLREAARYMTARVEVNRAQVNLFDEYGYAQNFDKVDQKVIAAADTGLRAYLKDYPKGAYAASAQGLLRRVYWFGNKRDQLAAQYVAMFGVAPAARGIDDADLAEEIDTKLLPQLQVGDTTDPILLAVLDLRRMRIGDTPSDSQPKDLLSLDELNGQRGAFAGNMPLFDFLVAAHTFYVGKEPADVLKLIPDAAKQPGFSDVQFSRQMLRGMALETLKDRNARGFWIDVISSVKSDVQYKAAELALALHDERSGGLSKVFAPDSPIRDAQIRGILLTNVADAPLLRAQANTAKAPHERELALFTLLYKELSRGAYRDFNTDLALVPANASADANFYGLIDADTVPLGLFSKPTQLGDFGCPALRRTTATLAATPGDVHAQLCLADYFRASGFDDFVLDKQPPKQELGGSPTLFAGPVYSRLQVYKRIIADPKAAGDDKAYALYRAVMCYAPSGTNTCGGVEVDKPQRKAWFTRLKVDYPKSPWATDLRYYW